MAGVSATIVTGTPGVDRLAEVAAQCASGQCDPGEEAGTAVVIELDRERPRSATVIATAAAKELERRLREVDGLRAEVAV